MKHSLRVQAGRTLLKYSQQSPVYDPRSPALNVEYLLDSGQQMMGDIFHLKTVWIILAQYFPGIHVADVFMSRLRKVGGN